MKLSSLFQGVLLTLNVLLLLQALPAVIVNVEQLQSDTCGSQNITRLAARACQPSGQPWSWWLFIVTSFVTLLSSFLAFWASVCMRVKLGRFILWTDVLIKLAAMVAYGVLVGFAISDAVKSANKSIYATVAKIWFTGIMEFFLCLAIVVFELAFLLWRKQAANAQYQELSINTEVWN